MEDLPLGRITALVPDFAVKDLPLGRTLIMMMMYFYLHFYYIIYIIMGAKGDWDSRMSDLVKNSDGDI